ncbi:solute carrier family 35 member F3-like isoform X2 [Hyla sarda]|uniref:solute carrier family 35 member F3-like isoform X2 n=1 Tax=Hyla sarda TaxID=327740 RepID=UPI0024C3E1DD|nr:solute carrier family 35 member F3-like isoform X2 [Hyla sarda]
MEGESVKVLTAKVSPTTPTSSLTINETEDTEQPAIQWRGCGRFLLSAVLSAPLWGCGTHTASFAVEDGWSPVFLAWLCSVTSVLATILWCIITCGRGEQRNSWKLGPHSVTAVLVMKRILPICSLSLLARSLYFLALRSLCTSEAAALYSCNKAFCYLLSWTILRDQFLGTRVVAVICCMAGVVMMSYAERPEEEAQNGQILALSAAVVTAFNEVLFRLLIGRLNSQESAIFLGLCSICSSLFLWWIPLLIYLQQPIEVPELSAAPSMEYLSVTVILFFLFQFMEKIGVQFFPTSGVSLGIFLSVAVITAVDHRWEVPSTGKLMGILAIGIGTVLVIVPENWEEYLGLEFSEQFHQEDIPEETKSKSSLSAL